MAHATGNGCVLLSYCGLPEKFWGYAFLETVYILNRIWSQGSRTIPYLAVTGHKPDLSNLRIFGCPAYVHIDKILERNVTKLLGRGSSLAIAPIPLCT